MANMPDHQKSAPSLAVPPNPAEEWEIQQREPDLAVVPVKVLDPVTMFRLPARKWSAFTVTLSTTFQQIASGPDFKRSAIYLSFDGDMKLSFTGASGSGATLHALAGGTVPMVELPITAPIYAAAVSGTVTLGVIIALWAD